MNTAPQMKRHEYQPQPPQLPDGESVGSLFNADMGARFADVITRFEHLEAGMAHVLAVLLGGYDDQTAGYVLRAIINPSIKKQLMWNLIQKAPINKKLSAGFDQLISDYGRIASERNHLVHGQWWTHLESGRVFLCESDEHGLGFFEAKEVFPERFDRLAEDIANVYSQIIRVTFPEKIDRRRSAGLPDPNLLQSKSSGDPPKPPPKNTESPPES